ncbi:formate-dependent phosphoribosylglycinamide formyltransferase [Mycolicibacterium thermoresistibile]|uniref:Phosphoribosylglycinamide formyltransferase 2 n=1 Tax=Mycolicibacterium thermoresistibile TaxID=1797 RepID=A0A100XFY1_MYCTH|nr:formate-dependent phosphoribosylglycinamide formyltransferase [Mycolicibacterium thermoresistibile]MCV7190879.1 formate-dependent phosphoribosylglycinamide formyltransferase [Mycolicibacterium thermoresistibile]GAT15783.1 phosphoribosylglycinamide formyltransferase 2 [Mycolicibacterium thermoresistibile]SNW16672.1 formate-dependent phosphoribosylglycinamide formyltransferase (GAR transformylase) [Mycolicibacterium thermoresistibile]
MSETTEGRDPVTDPATDPTAEQATDPVAEAAGPGGEPKLQAGAPVDDEPAAQAEPARPARPTVMLLGAGELSRELVLAFQRLGAEVVAVDRYADAPAYPVADRSVVATMSDADALTAVIEREAPQYVVAESTAVAVDALIAVAERGSVEVFPTPRAIRLSYDREGLRRLAADELGLPTAPFWFAGSVEELTAVAQHAGFPLVVRPVTGPAGSGQSVLLREDDVEPAWHRAIAAGHFAQNRVMAETVVEIDYEVTMLTVRTTGPAGPTIRFCEPIGHHHRNGEVLELWQPQQMSPVALDAAKSIAARIVNSLGGRGVYGVELLVRDDEVYFSDVRVRPQDTGLVTLRSQRLSHFELHARAILGLAVDTIMISPAAAEVHYGGSEAAWPGGTGGAELTAVLREALSVPESDVRLFGGPDDETDAPHRLGVALATAPDATAARRQVRQVSTALRRLW